MKQGTVIIVESFVHLKGGKQHFFITSTNIVVLFFILLLPLLLFIFLFFLLLPRKKKVFVSGGAFEKCGSEKPLDAEVDVETINKEIVDGISPLGHVDGKG